MSHEIDTVNATRVYTRFSARHLVILALSGGVTDAVYNEVQGRVAQPLELMTLNTQSAILEELRS
jgi:hypothetical protein